MANFACHLVKLPAAFCGDFHKLCCSFCLKNSAKISVANPYRQTQKAVQKDCPECSSQVKGRVKGSGLRVYVSRVEGLFLSASARSLMSLDSPCSLRLSSIFHIAGNYSFIYPV